MARRTVESPRAGGTQRAQGTACLTDARTACSLTSFGSPLIQNSLRLHLPGLATPSPCCTALVTTHSPPETPPDIIRRRYFRSGGRCHCKALGQERAAGMLRTRARVQKRIREDAEDREAGPAGALASASTSSPGLTATETEWRTAARV